jgi:hypothetical protein
VAIVARLVRAVVEDLIRRKEEISKGEWGRNE